MTVASRLMLALGIAVSGAALVACQKSEAPAEAPAAEAAPAPEAAPAEAAPAEAALGDDEARQMGGLVTSRSHGSSGCDTALGLARVRCSRRPSRWSVRSDGDERRHRRGGRRARC